MARQITDWLCVGIAPELRAATPDPAAPDPAGTDPAGTIPTAPTLSEPTKEST
ncbi:hypothetical protein ACOM2C_03380 [Pseudarthrobacter sp. So.54]